MFDLLILGLIGIAAAGVAGLVVACHDLTMPR